MAPAIGEGMGDRTTISVSGATADTLHSRKKRGDSYEDVIQRLFEKADGTPDERLKRLSTELDEPITVGERVYEDGDMHELATQSGETA
jgi:predicted CopG family antitoxin